MSDAFPTASFRYSLLWFNTLLLLLFGFNVYSRTLMLSLYLWNLGLSVRCILISGIQFCFLLVQKPVKVIQPLRILEF